jgi:hypothetical protein
VYVTEVLFPRAPFVNVIPVTCYGIKKFQLRIISADLEYVFFGGIIFSNVQ